MDESVPRNEAICLERMLQAAQAAVQRILPIYADAQRWQLRYKADASPLTLADRQSHDCICAGLAGLGYPVISEEMEVLPACAPEGRYFLLDPLDGTREFLAGNGEFTVNIALIEDGRPLLAVIAVPADGRLFHAQRGQGAWQGRQRLRVQPVSRVLRVGVSRHHGQGEGEALAAAALGLDLRMVARGSSLKMVDIATGELDFCLRLGPTMAWDTAAAQLLLEEAGGGLYDLHGEALVYRGPWRNPGFFATALSVSDSLALLSLDHS